MVKYDLVASFLLYCVKRWGNTKELGTRVYHLFTALLAKIRGSLEHHQIMSYSSVIIHMKHPSETDLIIVSLLVCSKDIKHTCSCQATEETRHLFVTPTTTEESLLCTNLTNEFHFSNMFQPGILTCHRSQNLLLGYLPQYLKGYFWNLYYCVAFPV